MKQNDWIVASINNPTYDSLDFRYLADMNLDNTLLLSKNDYIKTLYIKDNELFKDKQGNFNENLFNDFYNQAVYNFKEFSTENEIDEYQYSIWDISRPKNAKIKNPNFNIEKLLNPLHISIGISGINELSESNKSNRELAQNSKIYDLKTGKYLDKSVNDISLFNNPIEYFKSLFDGDPLVYATYDEDTEEFDSTIGKKVLHKKGEWKLNDEGEYYVEKLNGRSLVGKQVVSAFDFLTPENSGINEYDFFDSDDLKKSIGGNIAKNIAAIIPMLIPYVKVAYSGLLVSRELSKSLPMLYGMIEGFQGNTDINSKLFNTMAAYGDTFTGSSSDYAQLNTFSFENFANLMSDVALQWGQLKFIALTFAKLTSGGDKAIKSAYAKALKEYYEKTMQALNDAYSGKLSADLALKYIGTNSAGEIGELIKSGKWVESAFGKAAINKYVPKALKILENRIRTGQNLSLVYMALVSNTDVYSSVLLQGGTPQEAAAIALGSIIGMYSVDKYLGLGEMFFLQEPARLALRQAAVKSAEDLMSGMKIAETLTKKGIIGLIQRGIDSGRKTIQNYHGAIKDRTLGFVGKSLGEGLEEVSEELVADISKTLGELAGKLGYFSQSDYGAWENAFDRYVMSFLGGFAGGGLFYGINAIENRNKSTNDFQTDLIYLLRQGKKKDIISEFNKMKKDGKLGNKNLSFETTEDSDGNKVYLTASKESESQSEYIYNTLVKAIDQLDFILNENQLNLSDDEIFDKMVQGEYRALALTDFLKRNRENTKNISYITLYQEDFLKLTEQIVNKESEIQQFINSTTDPAKRNTDFLEKLDKLKSEKQELLNKKNYLFGEGSLGYIEKMLFAIDTGLSSKFLNLTFNEFIKNKFNKSIDLLTTAELENVLKEWNNYTSKKDDLDKAFKLYKEIERKINPSIQNVGDNIKNWENISQKFIESFNKYIPTIKYEDKIERESDEEYNYKDKKKENETDELYEKRIEDRKKKIDSLNEQAVSNWINEMLNNPMDRNLFRLIKSNIQILKRNLALNIIEKFYINDNPELTHKIWNLLGQSDLSNIKESIKKLVLENIKNKTNLKYAGRTFYNEEWDRLKDELWNIEQKNNPTITPEEFDKKYPYLTYGDIYTILLNRDLQISPNEYLKEFDLNFDNSDKLSIANSEMLKWYSQAITDDEIRLKYWTTPIEITLEYIDNEVNDTVDSIVNDLDNIIDDIVNNLQNNSLIKSLSELENKTFEVNPVSEVVNTISKISSNKDININEFLELIYAQYQNGESALDFILSEDQEKILTLFIKDLSMAGAFIHAASVNSNYEYPILHNKSINQFIKNHKDIFNSELNLPEINDNYANLLINELNLFSKEALNWLEISRKNLKNSLKKFKKAEQNYINTISEFYRVNRDKFKINKDLDLLEGYESLPEVKSLLDLAKVEQLIYNNYKKAKNINIEDILNSLIPNITNENELVLQLTSKLDEKFNYSKLTSYDKLMNVITNICISPKEFYTKLDKFIDSDKKLAPILLLEYVSRVVLALQKNPELINKVLEHLHKKLKLSLPILKNTSIVLGVGGAGKTSIIAKMTSLDGEGVLLSGPKLSLVDNLLKSLPKGQGKTKLLLMEYVMGSEKYAELQNSITKNKNNDYIISSNFGSTVNGLNGNKTCKLKDSVTVNKVQDPPKFIVIDEATHFNTIELLILSKFAELNNIQLLLLGDDHQNGSVSKGLMMNLDKEVVLSWRTPNLFLSLRSNNSLKNNNLHYLIDMIDTLDEAFISGNEEESAKHILEKYIPYTGFNYYNKDKLNGELITNDLTEDLINKLSGSIGFIGTSNSLAYKKLINSGKENITLIDPLDVLGLEFDYVIVDKEFKLKDKNASSLYFFLRDLYTMISRSKNATILINRDDLSILHNIENDVTGIFSLNKAIDVFREKNIPVIKDIANLLEEYKDSNKPEKEPNKELKLEEEPEELPIIDNSKENEQEIQLAQSLDRSTSENITTPIRCYSNVSYSGIKIGDKWVNVNDSHRDLGIFVRNNEIIEKSTNKDKLVRDLISLKCIFNYGLDNYYLLPKYIKDRFNRELFENSEYYISVQDANDYNTLIGLTNLKNEDRTINGKVVTLVAKFKDINGETWELTLGGLANPKTWKDNEPKIRKRIEQKIQETNSVELLEYLDNLSNNIINYENRISLLTKENLEYRINKPNFSGLTSLVKSDEELRLMTINTESNYSPFDQVCLYTSKSDVYILTEDYLGVSSSLKGRPVMYVSGNILLDPKSLKEKYESLKNDNSLIPQVRMLVLDNMGVSFSSLYKKKYKDIYTISYKDNKYYYPFDLQSMGVRMYKSIWNFRANLKNFLQAYNDFKNQSNLSQEKIINLCKLDNLKYNEIKGDQKYINEQEYRSRVDDKTKEILKPIWNFNDSLENYREFRLGYSNQNGVYLRKLTNLKEDGPYKGKDLNKIIGIYINPDLAELYIQVVDNIFTNILDKIVPTLNIDPLTYITKNLEEGWFKKISKQGEISVTIEDYSNNRNEILKRGTLIFLNEKILSSIPMLLIKTAKYLDFKNHNLADWELYLLENDDDKYLIKYNNGLEDILLNWWEIDNVFENGKPIINTNKDSSYNYLEYPIGVNPYGYDENKKPYGIIDDRLNNMFSLMFHGLTSTRHYNDFTKDEIRATDAEFKYGFFIDPVLALIDSGNATSLTITNKRLFGAKVFPGLPIIGVSLEPYKDNSDKTDLTIVTQQLEENTFKIDDLIINEESNIGNLINLSEEDIEEIKESDDKIITLEQKIKKRIESKFNKAYNSHNNEEIIKYLIETYEENGKLGTRSKNEDINNYEELKWDSGILYVKTKSGKLYEINSMGNIIEKIKLLNVVNSDSVLLHNKIVNILKELFELDDDNINSIKSLKKLEKENSNKSMINIINELLAELENTFDEGEDIVDKLNKLDEISNLKKTCEG